MDVTGVRIISVDDHVVEPPTLWSERLSSAERDIGPRVERRFGSVIYVDGRAKFVEGQGGGAAWCDVWRFEEVEWPLHAGLALAGRRDIHELQPMTYDDISPGCWKQSDRLTVMDENNTEASLCFPTVPRFCGQMFNEASDRTLAADCVRAFNDWMIDDWCGGAAVGRLIPLTLIPLWDPSLAASEVRRCAEKGSHAITFSESPHVLGLPSLYSGEWAALLEACEETQTVVNMHVGSSSKLPTTAPDAGLLTLPALIWQNAVQCLVDWVVSGALASYPNLKIALSEGQVGWIPFVLERLDVSWKLRSNDGELRKSLPELPSSYAIGRVFGCIFDDLVGLKLRDEVGMESICFETDYPHVDSTYPDSMAAAVRLAEEAGLSDEEFRMFVRGNAIEAYGLERYGLRA